MRYVVLSILWCLLLGCGAGYEAKAASPESGGAAHAEESYDAASDEAPAMDMEEPGRYLAQLTPPAKPAVGDPQPQTVDAPTGGQPPDSSQPSKITEPLLIYTATVHLAVFEAPKVVDGVQLLAKDMGGYLVQRADRRITVRVPSKRFHEALDKLIALGDVLSREESVKDVTEEFFDMTTRLRNARAMRDRLEKLLADAKNVEEALAVERELQRITEQIELMEGKLKLLKELVAFSTITVVLEPKETEQVTPTVNLPFPWLNSLGLSSLMSL